MLLTNNVMLSVMLWGNFALLRENFALLTPVMALVKFMDCVLDFQIRICFSYFRFDVWPLRLECGVNLAYYLLIFIFFIRWGGVNVPNRTIEDVVISSVCEVLIHSISPLVSCTRCAHSRTKVAILQSGVLLGLWLLRAHIRVRIVCRKLRRHLIDFTIPFVHAPVSCNSCTSIIYAGAPTCPESSKFLFFSLRMRYT